MRAKALPAATFRPQGRKEFEEVAELVAVRTFRALGALCIIVGLAGLV